MPANNSVSRGDRRDILQLWDANKSTITAQELNMHLGEDWAKVATVNFDDPSDPTATSRSFVVRGRTSRGEDPKTHIHVHAEHSKPHVLKRLAYPSEGGSVMAERLVQDLRSDVGEGVGVRAVRKEEEMCCGREQPCKCNGWREYIRSGFTAVIRIFRRATLVQTVSSPVADGPSSV